MRLDRGLAEAWLGSGCYFSRGVVRSCITGCFYLLLLASLLIDSTLNNYFLDKASLRIKSNLFFSFHHLLLLRDFAHVF